MPLKAKCVISAVRIDDMMLSLGVACKHGGDLMIP